MAAEEPRRVTPSFFRVNQRSEVLFPNEFRQDHPGGDTPAKWQDKCQGREELKNIQLPIFRLVHATHEPLAREIRNGFLFNVSHKFGKVLSYMNGKPRGGSFKFDPQENEETKYARIPRNELVFPGYYSWWGIDCSAIPNSGGFSSSHTIAAALDTLAFEKAPKVPKYLKKVPESNYGDCAFSCNFRDLLGVYADSRGSGVDGVCIRKGGTLRYHNEICYVLIVCIDADEDLSNYPLHSSTLQPQKFMNLTDNGGKIIDGTVPTFCPELIVIWANDEYYSYETAAFAFYFPDKEGTMALGHYCSEKKIMHYPASCHRRQPPEWKCPYDM